jgi:hypothetical protein
MAIVAMKDGVVSQRVVLAAMLRSVFASLPSTERIVASLPPTLEPYAPLCPGAFEAVVPTSDEFTAEAAVAEAEAVGGSGAAASPAGGDGPQPMSALSLEFSGYGVMECHRDRILPYLRVRYAAVEDYDDLLPVFEERSEVVRDAFGEFFLADVIESADEVRQNFKGKKLPSAALVGVSPLDDRAVALVVATSDPDVSLLAKAYDLTPFNGLRVPTPQGVRAVEAEQRMALRRRRDWLACLGDHSLQLAGMFDELSHGDGGDKVLLESLSSALNRAGESWGFQGPCGVGLGDAMIGSLRAEASRADEEERLVAEEAAAQFEADGGEHRSVSSGTGKRLTALSKPDAALSRVDLNTLVDGFAQGLQRSRRRRRLATLWGWSPSSEKASASSSSARPESARSGTGSEAQEDEAPEAVSYVAQVVREEMAALEAGVRKNLEAAAARERDARRAEAARKAKLAAQHDDSDEDYDDLDGSNSKMNESKTDAASAVSEVGPAEAALAQAIRVPVNLVAGAISERAAVEGWPWPWDGSTGGQVKGPGFDLLAELEALAIEAGAADAAGVREGDLESPSGTVLGTPLLGDAPGLVAEGAADVVLERIEDTLGLWENERIDAGAARVVVVGSNATACRAVAGGVSKVCRVPVIDAVAESLKLAREDAARETALAGARSAEYAKRKEAAEKQAAKKKKPVKKSKKSKEEEKVLDLTVNLDADVDPDLLAPLDDGLVGPLRWLARRLGKADCARGYALVNWSFSAADLTVLGADNRRPPLTMETAEETKSWAPLAIPPAWTDPTMYGPSEVALSLAQNGSEPTLVVAACSDAKEASECALKSWACVCPVATVEAFGGPKLGQQETDGLRTALVVYGAVGLLEDADANGEDLPDGARQEAEEAGLGPVNAVSISLFGIAPEWESRALDLLPGVFEAMPHAEYAILALPHASFTPPLADWFVPVHPVAGSTLQQRLFVAHRASLLAPAGVTLRPSTELDRLAILHVAGKAPSSVPLLRDVAEAVGQPGGNSLHRAGSGTSKLALTVEFEGQVIGAVVVGDEGCTSHALEALKDSYRLEEFVSVSPAAAASLRHVLINPIFGTGPTIRHVLSLALIAANRRVLLYRGEEMDAIERAAGVEDRAAAAEGIDPTGSIVAEGSTDEPGVRVELGAPCFVDVALDQLLRVRPAMPALPLGWSSMDRASVPPRGEQSDEWRSTSRFLRHPLFVTSRRLLTEPRTVIGARIVIVGASDCGLSALAQVLSTPHLRVARPTIISPGGLRPRRLDGCSGLLSSFGADRAREDVRAGVMTSLGFDQTLCHEDLRRWGITASSPDLHMIDGSVTAIERDTRNVVLQDGSRIPYDVLVLTPGLTESTGKALGWDRGSGVPSNVVVASGAGAGARLISAVGDLLGLCPNDAVAVPQAAEPDGEELRVGVDNGRDVVVWGDGFASLTATRLLLEHGVSPKRILLVRRSESITCLRLGSGISQGSIFADPEAQQQASAAETEALAAETTAEGGEATASATTVPKANVSTEGVSSFAEEMEAWLVQSGVEILWGWRLVRVNDGPLDTVTNNPRVLLGLQSGGNGAMGKPGSMGEDEMGELAMTEAERLELEEALDEIDDEEERHKKRQEALRAARLTAAGLRDISLDCRLLVCGDVEDVDPRFFAAANSCGLVYDGRLVVDHRFTTTDPFILAGGRVAKFSRRFRSRLLLQDHNSVDVGRSLGREILACIDPLCAAVAAAEEEDRRAFAEAAGADGSGARGSAMLPILREPRVILTLLPGDRWFLRASLPQYDVVPGGRVIMTRVKAAAEEQLAESFQDRVSRVVIDRHGRTAEIGLLCPTVPEGLNLTRVVGLASAWLRGFERDLRNGRSRDIVWQLQQPWAAAILHQDFASDVEGARKALVKASEATKPSDDGNYPDLDEEGKAFIKDLLAKIREATESSEQRRLEAVAAGSTKVVEEDLELLRADLIGAGASRVPVSVRRASELRAIQFVGARRGVLPRYLIPSSLA